HLGLGAGIAVGGGAAHVIFLRRNRVGVHRGAGYAGFQIAGERYQRVGHIALVAAARLDILFDDLGEELERLVVVARHAVAGRIHARELPGGADLAVLSGVAIGFGSLVLVAALVGGITELEDGPRVGFGLHAAGLVEHPVVERQRAVRARGRSRGDGAAEHATPD